MEKRDIELIEINRKDNYELDRLYQEHVKLNQEVEKLESSQFLTPEQKSDLDILKKTKLDGRDKLEVLLEPLR